MVADESSVPWDSQKLRAVLACTLVLPLGVALLTPVLPVVRDSFAVTDARASLLITLYFLPGVVLSPLIGVFADRYGRRRVLIPSLVAFGLAGGAIAVVDAFAAVLALRLVQGAGAAGVFILTVTFVSCAFEGVQRNAVLGVNSAVLFAGAAVYPFAGGLLASVDWHVPFYAYLAAVPVAMYAYPRLDDPPVVRPRTGPEFLRGAARALPRLEAGALYGATLVLETVAFGAVLTGFPFVLEGEFGASPTVIGGIVTAMMIVATVVAANDGRIARRMSNHRCIAICFLCYAVGLLLAWVASSVATVLGAAAVLGAGFGLVLPSVDAAIGRIAPTEFLAGALSIRNATTFLGRTIGPIAFTGAAVVTGYRTLFLACGVGTLAIGAAGMLVTDRAPSIDEESVTH